MHTDTDTVTETIISLERHALDHWNRGDVEGQLRFYADDVTYFDPITATRILTAGRRSRITSVPFGRGRSTFLGTTWLTRAW